MRWRRSLLRHEECCSGWFCVLPPVDAVSIVFWYPASRITAWILSTMITKWFTNSLTRTAYSSQWLFVQQRHLCHSWYVEVCPFLANPLSTVVHYWTTDTIPRLRFSKDTDHRKHSAFFDKFEQRCCPAFKTCITPRWSALDSPAIWSTILQRAQPLRILRISWVNWDSRHLLYQRPSNATFCGYGKTNIRATALERVFTKPADRL